MQNQKIGFIGVGVMGTPICKYIMATGHTLSIYTRTKSKAQELIDNGATWSESPKEVAENSDIIFTMVGFPEDVREVILGEDGILENAKKDSIIIDMTTSKPSLAVEIYEKAKALGIASIDSPVTGGDIGAKNGTLTIFCSGDKETFEKVKPILDLFGKNVQYVGKAGSGQHAKMANQISIAAVMLGTCETIAYAKKAGLDVNQMVDMVGSGSAGSWQMQNMGPRILKGDFDPGFFIKHFIKDLRIALEECEKMNVKLPGLELAKSLYDKAKENGYENLGTQALYKLFDE